MSILTELESMTVREKMALLDSIQVSIRESRDLHSKKIGENVNAVVAALKRIEADLSSRFETIANSLDDRANQLNDRARDIVQGAAGVDGRPGRDGVDGKPGRDGVNGKDGAPGRDGVDGQDGVSVTNAYLDFDNSLVIELSNGRQINAGEVLPPDIAEKLKIVINTGASGGGGSGDVVGPSSATDNAIARFDSTTGKLIQNSTVTVNDTGDIAGVSSLGVANYIDFDTTPTVTNAAGRLYWDSTQQTLTVGLNANIAADVGQTLYAYATNDEAVTINKGQPVYMYSAQGDRVSVKLAYNTGDATSAKTLGVCAENIAAGQAGMILCQGVQDGLDLSAYSPGDTLYVGATAGTLTNVKPYAPNHLVYVGVVERANAGNGRLYVRVQNGYELEELHNVSAQSPSNGQVLIYNASTSLWEKNTLTAGAGISVANGAGSITIAVSQRVVTIADGTSITLNADTTDIATQANTQATGTLTINAPTGTPVNGQKIILRLTSTNVQTFSWNAAFAGSTDLALPTASSGSSKVDYMGFIYNSTATKWHLLAKVFGF